MKESQTHNQVAVGLKICPVCGALNREICLQCYNCLWHGEFDRDVDHILVVLRGLGTEFGLTEEVTSGIPEKPCVEGFRARLMSRVSRIKLTFCSLLTSRRKLCS